MRAFFSATESEASGRCGEIANSRAPYSANVVARKYGLVYRLPDELRKALIDAGKPLPSFNGDESWELPLTATYVVAPAGKVVFAFVDADYRERLAPEQIIAALSAIGRGDASPR